MKNIAFRLLFLFVGFNSIIVGQQYQGPYFGLIAPDEVPEKFLPGLVSTEKNEHFSPTFSPDGKECFWSLWDGGKQHIKHAKIERGVWTIVEEDLFNPDLREDGAYFSPKGKRLYYYSKRDPGGTQDINSTWNVWYREREGDRWSDPQMIDIPGFEDQHIVFVSVASDDVLYFVSLQKEKILYRVEKKNGRYIEPQKLSKNINADLHFSHAYIDPHERYIIFSSYREGGYGDGDLYISVKDEDNEWGEAINLGPVINTENFERAPQITIDGKYFIFARHVMTDAGYDKGDFFWIKSSVILNKYLK